MTPSCFSLLGVQGALPLHYTDRVAASIHDSDDDGTRAFFDCLSHRSVALFYLASIRCRVEHWTDAQGADGYLPLQLALAGRAHGARVGGDCARQAVVAHYAALLRGRDAPGPVIGQILSAHFRLPVRIEQFSGKWEMLTPDQRTMLGMANCTLGAGLVLGRRYRRRDQCANVIVGPLSSDDYERFLPEADCARALHGMLAQFSTGTVRFCVHVILRARDVHPITLAGRRQSGICRLGWNTFLITKMSDIDREMVYWLPGEQYEN